LKKAAKNFLIAWGCGGSAANEANASGNGLKDVARRFGFPT
jgi:hypothetical protein